MMRCEHIQELIFEYEELPLEDERRNIVDNHLSGCYACRAEFELWAESAELIKSATLDIMPPQTSGRTSERVMDRIYQDESWRIPIPNRMYHISYRMRRQLTLAMSFFLAILCLSVYFSINTTTQVEQTAFSPYMPVASAGSMKASNQSISIGSTGLEGVPIASISDPLMLTLGPLDADPNYWLALSMFGLICILLIMSWLSRVRV